MAFINTIQSIYGIDCTYHKITKYEQNGNIINLELSSYLNKQARIDGKLPLETRRLSIPTYTDISILNESGMNHLKYAYLKLLEMSAPIQNSPMQLGIFGLGELTSDEPENN